MKRMVPAPLDIGYARMFLDETNAAHTPQILPHHLFVLAAASASKEYVCY
jgi:hypothetical protein